MRNTGIAWTNHTWNPWRGCTIVSEECINCYAMEVANRYSGPGQPYEGIAHKVKGKARWTNVVKFIPHTLEKPLSWKKPSMIFVNSMSDMFHESIPIDEIQQVMQVMRDAHWHTFQVLTKRGERIIELDSELKWADNIWLGVSVGNQKNSHRIEQLQQTTAKVKFLSMEPLIGPVNGMNLDKIDWCIVGGESGFNARPMKAEWALDILSACRSWGTAFFMKQMGSHWAKLTRVTGVTDKKGENFDQFPHKLQIREYPA